MHKRVATLLLGIGLIGLGLLCVIAPLRDSVIQLLIRIWPLFLVLAGMVRVAGYLIDHHPRSPVGGILISAAGGILLAVNFRGDRSLLQIISYYWFWFLLALIFGRLLQQYTHRPQDGPRPNAFTLWTIVLMLVIVCGGLIASVKANP